MTTNNAFKSDLPLIHNIIQNSMILYPKELVIATMRDFFAADHWYHYQSDHFGYPLTPDHTGLPRDAGLKDNTTTRLFIGENFRFDVVYYPAIIVRHGGSSSVPFSINREASTFEYDYVVVEDAYGNVKSYPIPSNFIFAGAWKGSLNIDVMARDLRARDDLVDLISLLFTDIAFNDLVKSGLIIEGVSAGAPTETVDRNDYIFRQSITLNIRSEWRRLIPIANTIEVINMSVDFRRLTPFVGPIAPNLTINTEIGVIDFIESL